MEVHLSSFVLAVGRNNAQGFAPLGTAFAVTQELFATAAHVVGQSDEGLCLMLPAPTPVPGYQDTTVTQVTAYPAKIAAYDAARDVAILQTPRFYDNPVPYVLGSSDDAPMETPILSLGFPHIDFGRLVLTSNWSDVGARVLLGNEALKSKYLVLNTQARPGQSGGPALVRGSNRVVAMVVGAYRPQGGGVIVGGVDPATLHQTTHAVSAQYIREMI